MYILSATYSQEGDFSKLVDCTIPLMSPITINGDPTNESVTSLRNKASSLSRSKPMNSLQWCTDDCYKKCQTSIIKACYALTWALVVFLIQTTTIITK